MLSYALRRIISLIPMLFAVSAAVFLMVWLIPGGPAAALLGLEADAESIAALNAELGFDRPFLTQYTDWLVSVARGDWGRSFFLQKGVLDAIGEYFGPTLSLAVLAQIISLIIALPLGILAARGRGGAADMLIVSASLLGSAVPGFLLSMFLMLLFSVSLRWLPVAGYSPLSEGAAEWLRHLLLPAVSLGLVQAAYITRMTRSALLDVLSADFIRTARSRGLGEASVIFSHALKNAAPTVLTAVGQSFGGLVTGTIVTETLFGIPGLGMLTMSAVSRRDVFVIQGVVLFVTLIYAAVNLAVDIVCGMADPRIARRR